ncbi:MAG: type II toxin-antitoxin system HicB family antitoxin [Planctomycetes bacterium]|nr:type II toxin-antitoxin system HicB family antitoxin [Planctomycetota bacterium]
MKYLILIETTGTGYSAYCPDVDGCVAAGATIDEVEERMRGALEMHLDAMQRDGLALPEPRTASSYVELPA